MRTTSRHPAGNDLVHACATYGLANLHDHTFPRPGAIRFFAVGYGGRWVGQTHEFEAVFRPRGGIEITSTRTNV